jgi:hypothetical protein
MSRFIITIRQKALTAMLRFQFVKEKIMMESIAMLTNELPLVMAPASLITALLAASLIRVVIQFTKKPFKVMAIGVMLALTAGTFMMQSLQ